MTPAEVKERVARIAAVRGDAEVAHSEEDDLHQEVLQAIANGASNAIGLAHEALKTQDIKFHRWCA